MPKPTKRQRKFQASGGIKGRIKKGIQFGGNKKRRKQNNPSRAAASADNDDDDQQEQRRTEAADDLTSQENLGDLDVESFFEKFDALQEQGSDEDDDGSVAKETTVTEAPNKVPTNSPASSSVDSSSENASSNDDSSDDDSEEEAEDPRKAEAKMKEQMAKLASSDPEFHEYLQENEKSLLEFGHEEDDMLDAEEEDDEDEEMEDEDEEPKTESSQQAKRTIELTPELLKSLAKGAFRSHGVKSLRRIVAAYRSACYLSESADSGSSHHQNYTIESSKVFNDLMILCLNQCHKEFAFHLLKDIEKESETTKESTAEKDEGDRHNTPLNPRALERCDRWESMRPILHSFFRSTLKVMSDAKDTGLLSFLLQALAKYLRFLSPFPNVAQGMLKSLAGLWSAPLDSSEDYQVVRLNSFLRIRQLALTQPFPFVEDCLKRTYLAYAKRAKFGSTNSPALPTLTFMGNCLVELYNLDFHSSYQHAFIYIRQLALLLRGAKQKMTPEALQQIHSWQYIQCLKLWVAVLSSVKVTDDSGDAEMMRSLVYPLTEIILATARSSPSVRHFPLQLHCVRLLQQLAAATQVFIPTTTLLFGCLEFQEWTLAPKKSRSSSSSPAPRVIEMKSMIQLGKEDPLRTNEQKEAAIKEWFLLIDREIDLYRYSAGFYEFSTAIVTRLRSFLKKTRNGRWRAMMRATVELCEKYGAECVAGRAKLAQAPKDVTTLECLKPRNAPVMGDRHKALLAKENKNKIALGSTVGKSSTPALSNKKKEVGKPDNLRDGTAKSGEKSNLRKQGGKKVKAMDGKLIDQQEDVVVEGIQWSDDDEE